MVLRPTTNLSLDPRIENARVDFAADQGREVFVVPGGVLSDSSAGCLRLLRDEWMEELFG